jgi:hypothetical protein
MIGANWASGSLPSGARVEVRVRTHGQWSGWNALDVADGGPDANSPEGRRASGRVTTEPLWVGAADGIQSRVVGLGRHALPNAVRLTVVDPGQSAADSATTGVPASAAWASTTAPAIYTRAQWGADESLRRSACPEGPDYNSTIKIGFVHHTDTPNDYSASDVPSIIRSIYAYHVKSNGWCDIGYNFLIDRFGRIWEGRYGGITKAVVGAHTGGFNTDSFGVAAIGTYTSTQPSSAMLSAYEHLFAWKLGLYFRDPTGADYLVSSGGGTDKWPTGQRVRFYRISGHRDAGNTTCPGDALYSKLSTLRSATRSLMRTIPSPVGDFTGDLTTDRGTWDPSTGMWHVGALSNAVQFGAPGDIPVPGDYLGNGTTQRAVWRPSDGKWYVDANVARVKWGIPGDIPVPADYNGDGKTDFAMYRPSTGRWYVDLSGFMTQQYGIHGDVPVPADYNGDGKADIAIWRPSNGKWWILGQGSGIAYGLRTDVPAPGDYDGDGRADRAVYRGSNGTWYVDGGRVPHVQYGLNGDVPAAANFAGSGIVIPAVYRPANGRFYVRGTSSVVVGAAGFEPLVVPYAIYHALPH